MESILACVSVNWASYSQVESGSESGEGPQAPREPKRSRAQVPGWTGVPMKKPPWVGGCIAACSCGYQARSDSCFTKASSSDPSLLRVVAGKLGLPALAGGSVPASSGLRPNQKRSG